MSHFNGVIVALRQITKDVGTTRTITNEQLKELDLAVSNLSWAVKSAHDQKRIDGDIKALQEMATQIVNEQPYKVMESSEVLCLEIDRLRAALNHRRTCGAAFMPHNGEMKS